MADKRHFLKTALLAAVPLAVSNRLLAGTPEDGNQNQILALILARLEKLKTVASGGNGGLINYYNEAILSVSFRGVLGGEPSPPIAIKVTRIGRVVVVDLPSLGNCVPTGNSPYLIATEVLPEWARPVAAKQSPAFAYENNDWRRTPGYMYLNGSTGRLDFYPDFPGVIPFKNGVNCGFYHTQLTFTL